MIRCGKCGFDNKDNAKFCKKCGAKLAGEVRPSEKYVRTWIEPKSEIEKEYTPVLKKETLAETKKGESELKSKCLLALSIGVIILIIGIVVIPLSKPALTTDEFWDKENSGEIKDGDTVRVYGNIRDIDTFRGYRCFWIQTSNNWKSVSVYDAEDITTGYSEGDLVLVEGTYRDMGEGFYGGIRPAESIQGIADYSLLGWIMIIIGIIVIIFSAIAYSGVSGSLTPEAGKGAGQLAAAFLDRPFGIPHCCIVGIAYGTPEGKELITLRKWRDEKLSKNKVGRTLIKAYYTLSPLFLIFIVKSEKMKAFTRMLVNPFVNFATATL
ncbi:MAG: zinc ribbon domain-containing protein [Actinobacteria bacterium]|nr:zinc ribbon domain-containing protein [Actinomycetota bacterium]MBU4502662.1 zinc ribbon domain-containing protein [Nanoarchaeota archaeon]MCG2717745.1 zinc ribbon domain-containing protein [Nanoarchaeota archaeon]